VIYIAIPAWNEARTLGVLLWKLRKVMGEFGRDYEILVCDDASDDGTRELLERYAKVLPLHAVRNEARRGYAAATEQLLAVAVERSRYPKRDIIVTLQGDFTERPEEMVGMIKTIEGGADVVIGELATPRDELPRAHRWARRIATYLLRGVLRGAPVSDPLSGFRAIRVIVVRKALREREEEGTHLLRREGLAANVELVSVLAPHARRIEEAPYRMAFAHRERLPRGEVWPMTRQLLELRGLRWPLPRSAPPPTGQAPTGAAGAATPSPSSP